MKIKNKGKVHPSPSSSSSDREVVVLSVLSLLPAAILALASVLSLEDREVLAYMLTRSLVTSSSSSSSSTKKKQHKKPQTSNNNGVSTGFRSHGKPPMFECECFDCYTSFWVRWDSSPNRDLIHGVIEAFEDHVIASGEKPTNRPNKKKLRAHKPAADVAPLELATTTVEVNDQNAVVSELDDVAVLENEEACCDLRNEAVGEEDVDVDADVAVTLRSTATASGSEHRGMARKVLPDVLGLLNSRLWSLWSPNA